LENGTIKNVTYTIMDSFVKRPLVSFQNTSTEIVQF